MVYHSVVVFGAIMPCRDRGLLLTAVQLSVIDQIRGLHGRACVLPLRRAELLEAPEAENP